jgi:hypothetical protein
MLDSIIGKMEGNVDTIYTASKVLDRVRMTEDEVKAVNLRQVGQGLQWDEADVSWEVEIPDGKPMDFLRNVVKGHDKWPVSGANQVIALIEQLEEE